MRALTLWSSSASRLSLIALICKLQVQFDGVMSSDEDRIIVMGKLASQLSLKYARYLPTMQSDQFSARDPNNE